MNLRKCDAGLPAGPWFVLMRSNATAWRAVPYATKAEASAAALAGGVAAIVCKAEDYAPSGSEPA